MTLQMRRAIGDLNRNKVATLLTMIAKNAIGSIAEGEFGR
jgi:hypothetical protein